MEDCFLGRWRCFLQQRSSPPEGNIQGRVLLVALVISVSIISLHKSLKLKYFIELQLEKNIVQQISSIHVETSRYRCHRWVVPAVLSSCCPGPKSRCVHTQPPGPHQTYQTCGPQVSVPRHQNKGQSALTAGTSRKSSVYQRVHEELGTSWSGQAWVHARTPQTGEEGPEAVQGVAPAACRYAALVFADYE